MAEEKTLEAVEEKKPRAKKEALPQEVTLLRPYGYIADDETVHNWAAGQVVKDPGQIADLFARKAPLVGIEHE